jgi:hypothetical protein
MGDQSVLNIVLYLRRWPGDVLPPAPMRGRFVGHPLQVDAGIRWRVLPAPQEDPRVPHPVVTVCSRKRDVHPELHPDGTWPYIRFLKLT